MGNTSEKHPANVPATEATSKGRMSNLVTALLLMLAILVGGVIAANMHKKRAANRIFTEPITTTMTIDTDSRRLRYRAHNIAGRAVLDIGPLRIVTPGSSPSRGSSSGSVRMRDNSDRAHTNTINVGNHRAGIRSSGGAANIDIAGTQFDIKGTQVTAVGETFDLATGQYVVVLDGSESIAETHILP